MMEERQVVYLAGAYRAPTVYGITKNIQTAREVAAELWLAGYVVFCPHMNTAHFDGLLPDQFWLEAGITFLERCDLMVIFGDNWRSSSGTVVEYNFAKRTGKPVYFWPEDSVLLDSNIDP